MLSHTYSWRGTKETLLVAAQNAASGAAVVSAFAETAEGPRVLLQKQVNVKRPRKKQRKRIRLFQPTMLTE